MSQQINLFNPIFLHQKKYFSATTMAQALGLILVGGIALTVYTRYQSSKLIQQAAATANQHTLAQAQLDKIRIDFATPQKNNLIEVEIQKADTEAKSLQHVFDLVHNSEFGNTKGYSRYLRAFSRQITSGLWLTGVSIYGAGNDISIQGRALQPELVPAYIGRLKHESVMQGVSFSALVMQVPRIEPASTTNQSSARAPVPAPYIEFDLRSSGIVNEPTNQATATNYFDANTYINGHAQAPSSNAPPSLAGTNSK